MTERLCDIAVNWEDPGPNEYPTFSKDRLERIGVIMGELASDPEYFVLLEHEIAGVE